MSNTKTQWNFHANQIEISPEVRREIEYGYGSPEQTISDSIYKYICYNNDYGYNQVEEWDTFDSIMEWLPQHIYKLLRSLEIVDSRGNSYGCGDNFFRPTKAQITEWAKHLSTIYEDRIVS